MSEVGEAMGTAAGGGLFARALEPDSGARSRHPDQPEHCLNCGTELLGAYCHACGQTGHIHRTIGGFMHDLMHGALHFEGKMWRTLPLLVFNPGKLTRRYIEGARARFVSPMALFLFSVFLMFAVFQIVGITAPTNLSASGLGQGLTVAQEQVRSERDEARADLAQLAANDPARAEAQAWLEEKQQAVDALDNLRALETGGSPELDIDVAWSEAVGKSFLKKWTDNPSLMLYKLQANSYKFSWLLIPLSIPFVWLLFAWKRRFKAYDHAIFVTYSLAFMSMLFIVMSVLEAAGLPSVLQLVFLLVPPMHLYKQLRGAYELSRFSAFWRLMVLSLFIWLVIALFLQVLLMLGAF